MKLPIFKAIKYTKRATILAVAGVVVVLLGGTSALAAKSNALPGSALYPFKRIWEDGKMLLSFSPASKAQTNVSIAQDRVQSAQSVVSQTPAATNGSNALTALEQAQQHLQNALNQTNQIDNSSQKKEVAKSISETAKEAETEAELEKSTETSSGDKQALQQTSDQLQTIQNQSSSDD